MKILINGEEKENIKAIQIDGYFVIVDSKVNINVKDWVIEYQKNDFEGELHFINTEYAIDDNIQHKIIASTKRIDAIIPLIVFKEQTVEEYINILLNDSFVSWNDDETKGYKTACISILKNNQAKYSDKKYTEANVFDFLNNEDNYTEGELGNSCIDVKTLKNYFKSLNQPKIPDVINLEMEEIELIYDYAQRLKTTSTPEGEIIEITI